MHKTVIINLLLLFTTFVYGQAYQDNTRYEITLSANRAMLPLTGEYGEEIKNKYGFGISNEYPNKLTKQMEFILGVKFNMISFWKNAEYVSRFSSYYDVTYYIYSLSIPLKIRISTPGKIKFFVSAGGYGSLSLGGRVNGMIKIINFSPFPYMTITRKKIKEKVYPPPFKFGALINTGIMLPAGKNLLIIKAGYYHEFITLYHYAQIGVGVRL